MRTLISLLLILVATFHAHAQVTITPSAPTYTATRLGTLGGNGGGGNAINASGEVTGFSYVTHWTPPYPDPNVQWHAFVYSGGAMRDLGTLGGTFSSGTGINANGQVAGFASLNNLPYPYAAQHAFLYSDGILHDLGALSGSYSRATGINANGQVVGFSESAVDPYGRAFLYSNGVMTDLGTLGGSGSSASGINATAQVTGNAGAPPVPECGTPNVHAFLYSDGAMRDLGTLGGCGSTGIAINDAGQVIGLAALPGNQATHAFLWSGGVMQDLGALGGNSRPFAINSKGQIVGTSIAAGGQNHAFLYTDGTMYDVNLIVAGLAGTVLTNATAINDSGQIVANGCSQSLICQTFRLDPVPAPPPVVKVAAVEFYYPAFDHYFVSADPSEISALDGGMFPGWQRTGATFNVYSNLSVGSASVCRFFSASFAPKSSHFYTPDAGECSIVKQNGGWLLEGDVVSAPVPDQAGNCPAGTQPVYRLYNNGEGAAPNHRYTTSLATRMQMMANGWIPEGYGPIGVIMCSPQ